MYRRFRIDAPYAEHKMHSENKDYGQSEKHEQYMTISKGLFFEKCTKSTDPYFGAGEHSISDIMETSSLSSEELDIFHTE